MINTRTCAIIMSFCLGAISTVQATDEPAPEKPNFRSYAFYTCMDAHGQADSHDALVAPVVAEAAALYEVNLQDAKTSQDIAWLIRSGCTIRPDAYLSSVAARAVRVLGSRQNPVATPKHPHAEYALTECSQFAELPALVQKRLTDAMTEEAVAFYETKLPDYWTAEYVNNLLHNACELFPGSYVYEMIGKMVRSGQFNSGEISASSYHQTADKLREMNQKKH